MTGAVPEVDFPPEEDPEKKKQREMQKKATKWTLMGMGAFFSLAGLYAITEWGQPPLDEKGEPVEDEFSHLPTAEQYVKRTWSKVRYYNKVLKEPSREQLLPSPLPPPYLQPTYTLVIELTGVLINPEWTYKTGWRFRKRPFVDYFINQCGYPVFELVIYTAEQGFNAMPLIDSLDPQGLIMYRLYRDSTRYENGVHMKDLSALNRDLR